MYLIPHIRCCRRFVPYYRFLEFVISISRFLCGICMIVLSSISSLVASSFVFVRRTNVLFLLRLSIFLVVAVSGSGMVS